MTEVPDGLNVHELSRHFGPRWVLVRVSVSVGAGRGLLLLGPNGSGKTTLLRCLATALRPHHGHATFEGRDLWSHRHAMRGDIALLSHASCLYDDLSGAENLRAWARMGALPADVGALLDRVGLADAGRKAVRTYSAGMRRRLALARVLLKQPRLVLFDEPFSALDPQGRELVGEVIHELRASGATLVLSTHHAALGARFCDDAMRLEAGQVVWRGPASDARDLLEAE